MSTLSVFSRRDPLRADFDALVRRAFGPSAFDTEGAPLAFTPAVESVRDGDDAVVKLELPGVDVEQDVTVEVVSGRLVVRGERRDQRTQEPEGADGAKGRRISEIRYGSFERSFGLPSHITADAVAASYDAGILSVRIAGVYAGTQPQKISITRAESLTQTES